MNKYEIAKNVLGFAAGLGAGAIVGGVVNVLPINYGVGKISLLRRSTVWLAKYALAGAVADVAEAQIGKTIDEVEAFEKSVKALVRSAKNEFDLNGLGKVHVTEETPSQDKN